MKRIFHLEANGKTNTGEYVSNIVSSLHPGNQETITILTSQGNIYKNHALTVFMNYGRTNNNIYKLIYYFIGWNNIYSLLSKYKNDTIIFHIHWPKFSPLDAFYTRLMKKHFKKLILFFTVHNIIPHEKRLFDPYFFHNLYNKADVLIFHTEQNQIDFLSTIGSVKAGQYIIPHYSYPVRLDNTIKIKQNSLLFFGNIRPYKGLDVLLEALSDLKEQNWTLTIAGNPEYDLSKIQQFAKDNHLEPRIDWKLKWISGKELDFLFQTHEIVVLPYKRVDSSGLLNLSMSYGKIIIASDIGGIKDLITTGENGILFTPNDSKSLSSNIITVLNNTERFRILGKNAKMQMDKLHSLKNIGQQLSTIYDMF